MKLFLLLIALSLSALVSGQNDVPAQSGACDTTLNHWTVETLPDYEGGNEKMLRDLNDRLNPEKHLNGTLKMDFLVNCKGKTSGYRLDSDFDNEFERTFTNVFSGLQNWKAGMFRNENVDCSYTLIFQIENGIIKKDE